MNNEEMMMAELKQRLNDLNGVLSKLDPVADFDKFMKIDSMKTDVIDQIIELDKASDARKKEDNLMQLKRMECETNLETARMQLESQEKINKINSKYQMIGMIAKTAGDLVGCGVQVGTNIYNGNMNRRDAKELGYACLGITENSVIKDKVGYQQALKSLERR